MKNRKLFPSLAQTNQTSENCSGYCDPACPYNCYYYYYLSPPPPLPVQDLSGDHSHNLSPYVIVAVSLLAGFFLIVSYYVIVSKYCARWLGSRRPPRDDSEFMDENRVDHPIWYIATVGLQQPIINSITVCRYDKDEGLVEGTDCSVCLNEFQDGETLRLLPKCNHAFHILCIDTWLRSHTNCPLCRAGIVLVTGNVPARIPLGQNSGDGARIMENQPEDSENRVGTEDVGESGETEGKEGENLQGVVDRELVRRKRAVSMDSAGAAAAASPAGLRDSEKYSSSVDRWLHLSPVPMKRSSSCGERLSLSSRRNIATLKGTL